MSIDLSSIQNKSLGNDFITVDAKKKKPQEPLKQMPSGDNDYLPPPPITKTDEMLNRMGINLSQPIKNQQTEHGPTFRSPSVPQMNPRNNQLMRTESIQDIEDKKKIIKKIQAYEESFSKFLTKLNLTNLEYKSVDELDDLLSEVKDCVSNRNINGSLNIFARALPYAIEAGGSNLGLNLTNYGETVNANQEYHYTVKELMIDYNFVDKVKIKPEMKLMYILAQSAFVCHMANSAKSQETQSKLNQSAEDLKFKYSGI